MSAAAASWPALLEVFRDAKLERVLGASPAFVQERLDQLTAEYARHAASAPRGALPPQPTADEISREYRRNPHRVLPLLQAVAFNCTPTMLAMMWIVQMGGRVEAIEYRFDRAQASRLSVRVELSDRATTLTFESTDHWDLAVLRLAGISKGDDKPLVESFFALKI
jgi:hypothetical protein